VRNPYNLKMSEFIPSRSSFFQLDERDVYEIVEGKLPAFVQPFLIRISL
jgi:hypothetical protein